MVIWDVAKLVISRLSLPLTSPSFIEFCQIITIWKNSKNKISSLACSRKIKKNRLRVSFSRMSVRQIIRRYRLKSFVDGNTGTGSILPGLDLRSDTITMPSQEIRQIMASAKVKKIQNEANLTGRSFVKCSNGFLHFKAKFSLWRFTFFFDPCPDFFDLIISGSHWECVESAKKYDHLGNQRVRLSWLDYK